MHWPWQREKRDSSYTDTLIQTIVSQASGATLAKPAATGALEASASIVARCFAAADVVAGPDQFVAALGPSTLSLVGRSLIRQGEVLFAIEILNGRVVLLPAASWDIYGAHDPATWTYRLTLGGPSRLTTLEPVPSEGMVHIKYQADTETPWRGVSPLASAAIAGRLSAETMQALADEASGPRGMLLPTPVDGNDPTITALEGRYSFPQGQARTG